LAYSGQIGGFLMETPATVTTSISGPDPVSETLAVEDEDPNTRVLKLVAPEFDRLEASGVHPSRLGPASGTGALVRSTPDIDMRRRFPPITCTACRVTYLTAIRWRASAPAAAWVCPHCLGDPEGEVRRQGDDIEVTDIEATNQPPE
jgi:hypothetical protein